MSRLLNLAPVVAALAAAGAVPVAQSQPIIPNNPLVQPSMMRPGAAASAAAANPAPAPRAAAARPSATPPPPAAPVPGLPNASDAAGSDIPSAVLERVSGLYVAAIVDRAAILRSQVAVPQVVFSAAAPRAVGPSTGSGSSGGSGSTASPMGGGAADFSAGAGGSGLAAPVYRAASYIVRDGQAVDFVDVHQVMARVSRDAVVLYLLAGPGADDRRARVIFRGTIDSVIAAPPTPPRAALEAPDAGLDGRARRELTTVDNRGGLAGVRGGTTAPGAPGSPAGNTAPR